MLYELYQINSIKMSTQLNNRYNCIVNRALFFSKWSAEEKEVEVNRRWACLMGEWRGEVGMVQG